MTHIKFKVVTFINVRSVLVIQLVCISIIYFVCLFVSALVSCHVCLLMSSLSVVCGITEMVVKMMICVLEERNKYNLLRKLNTGVNLYSLYYNMHSLQQHILIPILIIFIIHEISLHAT